MLPVPVENSGSEPRLRSLFGILVVVWLTLFVIAITGFPDLIDNERRLGGYVLDAVNYGHWLIQRDATGDVASKPPLLIWAAGLLTMAGGRLTRIGLYLPTAVAILAVAGVLLAAGRKRFGWLAGFLAALTYLLSPIADSEMTSARYDGIFTLGVLLAALAAERAWRLGRGWTWFWLAAAMATMTKGPLGVVLAASGLVAAIWEWRSGNPLKLRGSHWAGLALYLLICGGWFLLAYLQMGQPLIDKMIGRELVQHSLGDEEGGVGGGFYRPIGSVMLYYLPWSLVAAAAFWRVWKYPAADAETRRFERFLFCWFLVGLVMFSISPHQRARLILPLMPAAALLAGRELARLLSGWNRAKLWKAVAVASVAGAGLLALERHVLLRSSSHTVDTQAICALADAVRGQVGEQFPLTHVDSPYGLQFSLNTYRPCVSHAEAAALLQGKVPVFVAVENMDRLRESFGAEAPTLYEFFPQKLRKHKCLRIVSNHPRLEWTDTLAARFGPLELQLAGVKLLEQKGNDFTFERLADLPGSVVVSNKGREPELIRVKFVAGADSGYRERRLAPGETYSFEQRSVDHEHTLSNR